MIRVGGQLVRWGGRLDDVRALLWEIAVPKSVPCKAGVVVAGLLWVPGFLLAKAAVVTFADALFWQGVPLSDAFRVGYLHPWALTLLVDASGVPALCVVSTGGLGLALGWAAVARLRHWVIASVAVVLMTPFVALTCWISTADPSVAWWWKLQNCLGAGIFLSFPLWGICFWARSEKARGRWGWWPAAGWLGVAAFFCVIGVAAMVGMTRAAGGLPRLMGG